MTGILRNRICAEKSIFLSYIDEEKAFDKINRTLLLYKIWVTDLLYNATKTIYDSSNSYVESINFIISNFSITRSVRPPSFTLVSVHIK